MKYIRIIVVICIIVITFLYLLLLNNRFYDPTWLTVLFGIFSILLIGLVIKPGRKK